MTGQAPPYTQQQHNRKQYPQRLQAPACYRPHYCACIVFSRFAIYRPACTGAPPAYTCHVRVLFPRACCHCGTGINEYPRDVPHAPDYIPAHIRLNETAWYMPGHVNRHILLVAQVTVLANSARPALYLSQMKQLARDSPRRAFYVLSYDIPFSRFAPGLSPPRGKGYNSVTIYHGQLILPWYKPYVQFLSCCILFCFYMV